MFLLDKYGARLTLEQAGDFLNIPRGTLSNKRYAGKLGFKTYRDGMRVYVDARDLITYLDGLRK